MPQTAALRPDIASRADLVRLVDAFYDAVRADEVLGPIFDGVAGTDWSVHLPKMYDFWETVLFGTAAYHGNPMAAHLALSRRTPLGSAEFARWLDLFGRTVDAHFSGPAADDIKVRALRIATVLQQRINAPQPSDGEQDAAYLRQRAEREAGGASEARLPVRAVGAPTTPDQS